MGRWWGRGATAAANGGMETKLSRLAALFSVTIRFPNSPIPISAVTKTRTCCSRRARSFPAISQSVQSLTSLFSSDSDRVSEWNEIKTKTRNGGREKEPWSAAHATPSLISFQPSMGVDTCRKFPRNKHMLNYYKHKEHNTSCRSVYYPNQVIYYPKILWSGGMPFLLIG